MKKKSSPLLSFSHLWWGLWPTESSGLLRVAKVACGGRVIIITIVTSTTKAVWGEGYHYHCGLGRFMYNYKVAGTLGLHLSICIDTLWATLQICAHSQPLPRHDYDHNSPWDWEDLRLVAGLVGARGRGEVGWGMVTWAWDFSIWEASNIWLLFKYLAALEIFEC